LVLIQFKSNSQVTENNSPTNSSFGVNDVGVTAIIEPTCAVVPGWQSVIVVITNFGSTTETNLPIGVEISGNIPTTVSWIGSLPPLSSDTFELPIPFWIPSGPFSLCAYSITFDLNPSNDTTCISCNGNPMSINSQQYSSESKIIVSPNPSSGVFSLKFEEKLTDKTSLTITDILGKVVWKSDFLKPEFNIDISNEPNGVYLLNIYSFKGMTISKLILAK